MTKIKFNQPKYAKIFNGLVNQKKITLDRIEKAKQMKVQIDKDIEKLKYGLEELDTMMLIVKDADMKALTLPPEKNIVLASK